MFLLYWQLSQHGQKEKEQLKFIKRNISIRARYSSGLKYTKCEDLRIWWFDDFHDTTVGQTQQDEDTFFSKQ